MRLPSTKRPIRAFAKAAPAVLAGVLALTLAAPASAQGGGGDSEFTGEPVKIMSLIPQSAAIGATVFNPGVEAAVNAVNERGGLEDAAGKTHEVELEICDPSGPNPSEACAQKAVDEGYLATVGDVNVFGGIQANEVLSEAGVPQVGIYAIYPAEFTATNSWPLVAGSKADVIGMVAGAKKAGAKTIHALISGSTGDPQLARDAYELAADEYGIEIVGTSEVPLSAADLSSFVQSAQSEDADAIVGTLPPPQVVQLFRALPTVAYDGIVVTTEGLLKPEAISDLGDLVEGTVLAGPVPPFGNNKAYPDLKQLEKDLKALAEQGDPEAQPDQVTSAATRSWLAFQLFAAAFKTIDEMTPQAVQTALETMKDVDLGLIPVFTPSDFSSLPEYSHLATSPEFVSKWNAKGVAKLLRKKPIDALEVLESGG